MRNLKRALSLALASVMLLGMMVVGTGASYADVDAQDNLEAISVIQAVGVMVGDDNGNFNPDQKVTRTEMAVIMCNLLGLSVGGSHPFTDVPAWANGYVAACYNNGIIAGYSATTYGANDSVTAVQAALMIMKALGYFGYAGEFGDSWVLATVKQANEIDLYDGVNAYTEQEMTRNDIAQMVLNALECDVMVVREEGGLNVDGNGISVSQKPTYTKTPAENNSGKDYAGAAVGSDQMKTMQLCEKLYGNDLKKNSDTTDEFGRPATQWTYGTDTITTPKAATLTYTDAVKGSKIYEDLGKVNGTNMTIVDTDTDGDADAAGLYVDGQLLQTSAGNIPGGLSATSFAIASGNDDKVGAKGTLTEVYFDKDTKTATVVCINTYLAQASGDYNEKDSELDILVHAAGKTFTSTLKAEDFAVSNYSDEDFILVTAVTSNGSTYTVKSIAPATVVEDVKTSAYKARDYITAGGTKYTMNGVAATDASGALGEDTILDGTSVSLQSTTYDLVLDNYGYVIGAQTHSGEVDLSDYLFVTDFALNGFDYQAKVVFADGTKSTITVAKAKATTGSMIAVAGEDTANAAPATAGKVAEGWFYTYTVNKDNEYELTAVAAANAGYNASKAIDSGKVTIVNGTSTKGTSETVVIADGKVTVGIKNAPDVTAAPVWWLNDTNGYTLWVFSKTAGSVSTDADEVVYIYDATKYASAKDENDNVYYIYNAIVNGEKTTINVDDTNDKDSSAITNGLYVIGSYDDGYVDGSYLTKVASGAPSAAYKVASALTSLSYKNGTLSAVGTGDQGGYVLADNAKLYVIDTSDDNSVKAINGEYIKNLTIAGSNDSIYLVQESATKADIVAAYIVIA